MRKQVCFSTLTTFAHNQSYFGIDRRLIVAFVEKLSSINELEAEQVAMLRSMPVYDGIDVEQYAPKEAGEAYSAPLPTTYTETDTQATEGKNEDMRTRQQSGRDIASTATAEHNNDE